MMILRLGTCAFVLMTCSISVARAQWTIDPGPVGLGVFNDYAGTERNSAQDGSGGVYLGLRNVGAEISTSSFIQRIDPQGKAVRRIVRLR